YAPIDPRCLTESRNSLRGPGTLVHCTAEPCASVSPVSVCSCARDCERLGTLFNGEAGEKMEFDHVGRRWLMFRQSRKGRVQRQHLLLKCNQLLRGRLDRLVMLLEVHLLAITAVFVPLPFSGAVHQDVAHGLGCRGEEMPMAVPFGCCWL